MELVQKRGNAVMDSGSTVGRTSGGFLHLCRRFGLQFSARAAG